MPLRGHPALPRRYAGQRRRPAVQRRPRSFALAVLADTPMLSAGSSFPALKLEWSPTTNPGDPPVWVDITSRLRRFTINRGRRNWLSQMAPGTATFDLDNTDGAFTPANSSAANYPNLVPGKRVRLRAAFGGTTYPRFVGFTTGYPTTWRNTESQVTLACSDGLALLSLLTLPSVYDAAVLADAPTMYYRFTEGAGPTLADSSGNSYSATASTSGITYGQADPVNDGLSAALKFDGATGTATTPFASYGANWSAEVWFMIPVPTTAYVMTILSSDITSFPAWRISMLSFGAASAVTITLDAIYPDVGLVGGGAVRNNLGDGAWHHFVATWTAGNVQTNYIDGVRDTFGSLPAAAFPLRPLTIGGVSTFGVDNGVSLARVAFYSNTALSAAQVAAHYAAASAWLSDTSDARVGHILDAAGWASSERNIGGPGASKLSAANDLSTKSVQALLQDVGTTENGLAFINQAGQVTLITRNQLAASPAYNTPAATFGDNAAEVAYPMGDGKITLDDQDLWTQIQVAKKGGATFTATAASATVSKFYTVRQPGTVNTETVSDMEAQQLAYWLLNQSSTPAPRVDTLNMQGTAGNLSAVLARELGDLVTYKGRPVGVGTVSQAARILGMKESADLKERIWKTSWLLFAREPQPMVWDDPTYGKWDTYPWGI